MSIFIYFVLIIRFACKILRISKNNYKGAVFSPEVRASVNLIHKNWYRRASHSILKH